MSDLCSILVRGSECPTTVDGIADGMSVCRSAKSVPSVSVILLEMVCSLSTVTALGNVGLADENGNSEVALDFTWSS